MLLLLFLDGAYTTGTVLVPTSVCVFAFLKSYPVVADGAYDDVDRVLVTTHGAAVVVWPSMLATVYLFAVDTLKGHVVLLVTTRKLTMFTNFGKFHF